MTSLQVSRCRHCGADCVRAVGYCVRCIEPDPMCEHLWSGWTRHHDIEIRAGRVYWYWHRGCEMCGLMVMRVSRAGKAQPVEDVSELDAAWRATP